MDSQKVACESRRHSSKVCATSRHATYGKRAPENACPVPPTLHPQYVESHIIPVPRHRHWSASHALNMDGPISDGGRIIQDAQSRTAHGGESTCSRCTVMAELEKALLALEYEGQIL